MSLKLSIITVNLNNADGLRKTIESVLNQTYTHFEHIIIDGGSSDGSVEVIKEYEDKYAHIQGGLYWISEPDKGIYNGMNKGIKVAKGEYCQFLNSGDYFLNSKSISFFNQCWKDDLIFGNDYVENINGERILKQRPDQVTIYFMMTKSMSHSASFFKRELFEIYGGYDEKYKIAADYKYFLMLFYKSVKYRHIDQPLTVFETGGISSNPNYDKLILQEKENAIRESLPHFISDDLIYLVNFKKKTELLHLSRILKPVLKLRNTLIKIKNTFQ